HLPSLRTAALFAPKIMTILRKEKHLVKIADEFGADELSIHYSLATQKLIEKAGKRGLPVNIWTADNPRWVKRGIRLGLSSIITNDPARMLARREQIYAESR
ncbi:MAG: glycerophosphodiester phosphodiesterase family protein, partial [Acidobacteriota bacterium]